MTTPNTSVSQLGEDLSTTHTELLAVNASVVSLDDDLLDTQADLASVNATVDEIDARTWQRVYHESNLTGLVDAAFPDWFNTTTIRIQGRMMKLDWKLWNILGMVNYLDIRIYYANGTLLDSVGSIITGANTATVASERVYSVMPGKFYLSMDIRAGGYNDWYEVNVWDYY